jgi:hypothetical protein
VAFSAQGHGKKSCLGVAGEWEGEVVGEMRVRLRVFLACGLASDLISFASNSRNIEVPA